MWTQKILAAATLLTAAQALKIASPFFVLSSNEISTSSLKSAQIDTAERVHSSVNDITKSCAYQHYLLIHQDGLTATDLQNARAMPRIRERMANANEASKAEVLHVVGQQDAMSLQKHIVEFCPGFDPQDWKAGSTELEIAKYVTGDGKQETSYHGFEATKGSMESILVTSDKNIDQMLSRFDAAKESWILVYTSSPPGPAYIDPTHIDNLYEMDEPYPSLHQDLKRAVPELASNAQTAKRQDNSGNLNSDLPLFEKYQFFTPGIFMGLATMLLLIVIAYIGVSAISGMQVSYMAFSKEMGPAAQTKGKQQ